MIIDVKGPAGEIAVSTTRKRHKVTVTAEAASKRSLAVDLARPTAITGTSDYNELENRPQINGVLLAGNKSLADLGINIPDSTSDLINDSGFITAEDIPAVPTKTSDLQNDSGFITSEDIPIVPTKTSELQNDSGFITAEDIPQQTEEVTVSTSGDVTYSLEANKIYHFTGQISSLTLTLVATSLIPHYHFDFVSGTTPATISFGSSINWLGGKGLTPQSSMHYEVDILNGRGIFAEFPTR